ncbi:hypothetical protein [Moorena sp. SIO4G3]|uniref:hypothetical protein n=1 Tax=Moorena sp. SIO4G3 TaxID=2607821 RepID=UPI00142A0648|nr:hypothetical protein [Moorena sp. SIO4G3]NEO77244.1 hypothetical protein [Moorena sp. SIO4G3]
MGVSPKTVMVRFPCLDAVAHGGNPQDRAASLGELNSPRVAPLHRLGNGILTSSPW